jgi:parallel beta-helix repeat protein
LVAFGLALAIGGFAAGPAAAADYFVGPTGSDANSGLSPAQAFRTVQKGADAVSPGDTVHLDSGSYDETVKLYRSGSVGNPVTFTDDGNAAVMDAHFKSCPAGKGAGSGAPAQAFYGNNVHDVVLDGIEVTRYCYFGVVFTSGAHDIVVRNMNVHHNGITIRTKGGGGIDFWRTSNVLIENNVVNDNVPRSRTSGSGIDVNTTDQAIVRNNVVDRNNGNGILVEDATNALVEGNKARFNVGDFAGWGTSGIWLDGGHDVTLRDNWLEGNVWDGLQVSDEDLQDPYGYEIYNNVVIGNWYGMRLDGVGSVAAPLNQIYGNSFVDNSVAGIMLVGRSSSQLAHTRLYGNLLAQLEVDQPALQVDQGSYPDLAIDDNLYFRRGSTKPISWGYSFGRSYDTAPRSLADRTFSEYQSLSGWDAASISADPLFVNAPAGDYHLLAASPAIDAGSPLYSAATDYDGHSRPAAAGPDIGALEGSGPCAGAACEAGTPGTSVLDSSVLPVKAVSVTIPSATESVTKIFGVNVRNGDTSPRDPFGHRLQLLAGDGSCPAGTISGVPGFRSNLRGPESSAFMAGGHKLPAQVKLTIDRVAFAGVSHCTLQLSVQTPLPGNVDPVPGNDSAAVALNVSAL